MHFYVLNKYNDMKLTWLLCFYAFIAQKSFTTMNFSPPGSAYHFAHVQLIVSVINISGMAVISVSYFSMYRTKFDPKMIKSKRNYTANMIMNVSGTVCQHIHYFPGKQGLATNLTWLALKVNNARVF